MLVEQAVVVCAPSSSGRGWAMAVGKLSPSGSCWVSEVTRGHPGETWKNDGWVGPESESRFTATCFATGKD